MVSFVQRPSYAISSAFLAAVALFLALVAQYGFHLTPCPLCLYQRGPYVGILVVGWLAVVSSKGQNMQILLALAALWAISLVLGGYHSGVEAGFWTFAACSSPSQGANTIAELQAMIDQASVTRCDQPAFLWMGLSMADMNVLLSGTMVGWGLLAIRGLSKRSPKNKG